MTDDKGKTGPAVWAVGGGKGGVGKTVVTANLAIALAQTGRSVVIMDADLGGANLHTAIGVPHPARSLSHSLLREASSLEEVMVPTSVPNLHLISGAQSLLDMANPKYAQKEMILRHILALKADFVLLDLGAGSAFNTLDFFLAAREGLLVVIPEPTSVENSYHFIKAAFYRRLKRATQKAGVAEAVDRAMEEKVTRGIRSPRELIRTIMEMDPQAGDALLKEARSFAPKLVVNQVTRWEDRTLGQDFQTACSAYFGIEMGFLGAIEKDDHVGKALALRRPILEMYPASPFARAVTSIARKLCEGKENTDGRPGPAGGLYPPGDQPGGRA